MTEQPFLGGGTPLSEEPTADELLDAMRSPPNTNDIDGVFAELDARCKRGDLPKEWEPQVFPMEEGGPGLMTEREYGDALRKHLNDAQDDNQAMRLELSGPPRQRLAFVRKLLAENRELTEILPVEAPRLAANLRACRAENEKLRDVAEAVRPCKMALVWVPCGVCHVRNGGHALDCEVKAYDDFLKTLDTTSGGEQ